MSAIVLSSPAAHADPTTNAAPPTRSNVSAYVALGTSAAAVGVGAVFGVLALVAKNDFSAHPTAEAADRAQTDAVVADVSFGVAIASGLTAIVLLVTNASSHRAPRAFVAPVLSPHGGGLGATLTF